MIYRQLLSPARLLRQTGIQPKITATIATALALLSPAGAPARNLDEAAGWRGKVDPLVLEAAVRFGETEFLAFFDEQADLSAAESLASKEAKGRYVFRRLTSIARKTQTALQQLLEERGIDHRSFWIANMIWIRGNLDLVEEIARRQDVEHLFANPAVALELPDRHHRISATAASTVESSIVHTGAPAEFWANGFRGQDIVIGGQDTGYDWDHPALRSSYRGWNGTAVDHSYNWHDAIHSEGGRCGPDSPEPCDDGSHGTHTMGTMVGDDGLTNQIGLAPEARWIGCRNMDQGVGTPATYTECFQWFVAPTDSSGSNPDPSLAPDVINNSWTCPPSEGCTNPNALRAVVENTRAAGILIVASAGNGGPGCSTIVSPIAIYDAVLTVGAVDLNDEIATFSSRGTIDVDGSGRRKPDIAAPGVSIRSSVPEGLYELSGGTSMAGPHVAGVAALVMSAAECKRGRPRRVEKHLLDSTLPREAERLCGEQSTSSVPNNTYGHGVLRAVLPSCPGDGRVAGTTRNLETATVLCRNKSKSRSRRLAVAGAGAWNCMARGLVAEAGDKIVLKLRGTARGEAPVLGTTRGLQTIKAVCRNPSSGSKVRLRLDGSGSWNCSKAGLEVEPGDTLEVTIIARATADS